MLTLKACEDDVEVPECDDGQKARIFLGSECGDLEDGDEFPAKKDLKDQNPCEGLEEVSSKWSNSDSVSHDVITVIFEKHCGSALSFTQPQCFSNIIVWNCIMKKHCGSILITLPQCFSWNNLQ